MTKFVPKNIIKNNFNQRTSLAGIPAQGEKLCNSDNIILIDQSHFLTLISNSQLKFPTTYQITDIENGLFVETLSANTFSATVLAITVYVNSYNPSGNVISPIDTPLTSKSCVVIVVLELVLLGVIVISSYITAVVKFSIVNVASVTCAIVAFGDPHPVGLVLTLYAPVVSVKIIDLQSSPLLTVNFNVNAIIFRVYFYFFYVFLYLF